MVSGTLSFDMFGSIPVIPNEGVWPFLGAVFVPGLIILIGLAFNVRHSMRSWNALSWIRKVVNIVSILVALAGLGAVIFIGVAGSGS